MQTPRCSSTYTFMLITGCCLFSTMAFGDAEDLSFVRVTPGNGITHYDMPHGMFGGVALADYDNDGDIDLYVPCDFGKPNHLYRNLGDGTFEDVATEVGLLNTDSNDRMALFIDYDGDHDLDVLIATDDHFQTKISSPSSLTLYRQESDGQFTNVTEEAGLLARLHVPEDDLFYHLGGVCAGDINNDDLIDIVLTFWRGDRYLYVNQGDGTFLEEADKRGLEGTYPTDTYLQPMMHDFNGDGWMDIFMAIDFTTNDLLMNQGDGTFVNVAPEHNMENDGCNDMGVTIGDYDNDGDFDLFVTNIADELHCRNYLWETDAIGEDMSFTERAEDAGVHWQGWGWGTTFSDLDNDTHLDLMMTNGFSGWNDRTALFYHDGTSPPTYTDIAEEAGLDDILWGCALMASDLDRDGDQDVVITFNPGGIRVMDNRIDDAAGSWIVIKPRMEGLNHYAIGATVAVLDGDKSYGRLISAGTSMSGQEPAEAHIGLGDIEHPVDVAITWPGGERRVVRNIEPRSLQTIMYWECPGDADAGGSVNAEDLTRLFKAWGSRGVMLREDANGDGRVDVEDILALLSSWGDCD